MEPELPQAGSGPHMRFRVVGFRLWGLGFRVEVLGFRVWGLGFLVEGLGFRVWSLGLGV